MLRRLSDSVAIAYSLTRGQDRNPLLVDLEHGQIWTLAVRDPAVGLELTRVTLPDGDRLVGVERLHGLFRLRAGLYEPIGTSNSLLVRGERGLYGWTGESGLVPWDSLRADFPTSYPESEAARVALDFVPTQADGLGFLLEVRDPVSGAVRFTHDFRPASASQRMQAGLAYAASFASAPIGALVSWARAPKEPRDVRNLSASTFSDPLLTGNRNTWLLLANLALGALLAIATRRRLSARGAQPELRILWTAAVASLGLAPYFLCLLLEPRAQRVAAAAQPREARREALVIQTA